MSAQTKLKEAMFWKALKDKAVQCQLCPHFCAIKEDERGKCGVRENIKGRLYALNYGKIISAAVDPVEKKPLFHFLPGTKSYSIATVGCNFSCLFCQNWEISQMPKPKQPIVGYDTPPDKIVEDAISNGCESISYTYTEPTIFFEYAYDTAKLAHKNGLKNIFVTNGYINKEPLDKIKPYLDAANVDLKGWSEDFYRTVIGGRLKPVLEAIEYMHKLGIWIEITTLIVPGHNDNAKDLKSIAEFIASVGNEIPWHISRFYPMYKMADTSPTKIEVIHKAVEIGKKAGLKYIYAGNVPSDPYESTYCPKCNKRIIERSCFSILDKKIEKNKCMYCKETIAGVFQ